MTWRAGKEIEIQKTYERGKKICYQVRDLGWSFQTPSRGQMRIVKRVAWQKLAGRPFKAGKLEKHRQRAGMEILLEIHRFKQHRPQKNLLSWGLLLNEDAS